MKPKWARWVAVLVCLQWLVPTRACSIFVLTDGRRTVFCNNEDWSNPNSRIWFVPGTGERHGAVYVGFDDDWAQGGMNSEGLAFDWVAGFQEKWERDPKMTVAKGNPSQRMLEACATVDQAVAFYEKVFEPSFAYGRMLVADRSGASAVIGAKDGRLDVRRMTRSRGLGLGFGMRGDFAAKMVAKEPEPTPAAGDAILKATRQDGPYATKYSNVFDLNSGAIILYRVGDAVEEPVRLNLGEELKRGGHYYEMPKIRAQMKGELKPLTEGMRVE